MSFGSVVAQRREGEKKPSRQMVNDITRKETKQRRGRETQNTGREIKVHERGTGSDTWEGEIVKIKKTTKTNL